MSLEYDLVMILKKHFFFEVTNFRHKFRFDFAHSTKIVKYINDQLGTEISEHVNIYEVILWSKNLPKCQSLPTYVNV